MTTRADWKAWAAERDSARLTDWLREISEPDWSATVNHPLFETLAEGRHAGADFAAK